MIVSKYRRTDLPRFCHAALTRDTGLSGLNVTSPAATTRFSAAKSVYEFWRSSAVLIFFVHAESGRALFSCLEVSQVASMIERLFEIAI